MTDRDRLPSPELVARWDSPEAASELARRMRDGVEIRDRRYGLRTFRQCFVGSEGCAWLVEEGIAGDFEQAELLGNLLLQEGHLHHVVREHPFRNAELFYRFREDEGGGEPERAPDGSPVSWSDFVRTGWDLESGEESLLPRIPTNEVELEGMERVAELGVEPLDEANARLLDHVHPRGWKNPRPSSRYNLVVVGAGAGGLVSTAGAAGVGAEVALVEERLLGGDCLNVGCVPSKALLRAAKAAAQLRRAGRFGVGVAGLTDDELAERVEVDFSRVMERLRSVRAGIAPNDAAERFAREIGADVFFGRAVFTGPDTLEVEGETLRFAKCILATGGSPAVPAIPGLAEVPFLTNANLFNLTRLPPRLGVIGTGVVGAEMAQAFARLGSQVTVLSRSDRILPREDPDAAAIVQRSLERDGVRFLFGCRYERVRHRPSQGADGWPAITVELGERTLEVDALLVATGRKPNVEGMGLEVAGVELAPGRGVTVDDRLQTTNPRIYAVGDVATRYQFTHAADFMARLAIRNALFFGRDRFSKLLLPWCTFTEPELAHVGLYPADFEERGIGYQSFTRELREVDRAILDDETEGFVRVHVEKGSDRILGATVVGPDAGNLISELTLAIQSGTGLGKLASVIHPYPTAAEAIRQLGDAYNRTRMTRTVQRIFRGLMAVQR